MNAITTGRKRKHGNARPLIMALEPRFMFDGAGVADAVDETVAVG